MQIKAVAVSGRHKLFDSVAAHVTIEGEQHTHKVF